MKPSMHFKVIGCNVLRREICLMPGKARYARELAHYTKQYGEDNARHLMEDRCRLSRTEFETLCIGEGNLGANIGSSKL